MLDEVSVSGARAVADGIPNRKLVFYVRDVVLLNLPPSLSLNSPLNCEQFCGACGAPTGGTGRAFAGLGASSMAGDQAPAVPAASSDYLTMKSFKELPFDAARKQVGWGQHEKLLNDLEKQMNELQKDLQRSSTNTHDIMSKHLRRSLKMHDDMLQSHGLLGWWDEGGRWQVVEEKPRGMLQSTKAACSKFARGMLNCLRFSSAS
jgi:hypothetical protein